MWPNPQFPADLVTFNEEILNGELHSLRSVKKCFKLQAIELPTFYDRKFLPVQAIRNNI